MSSDEAENLIGLELVVTTLCGYGTGSLHCVDMELVVTTLCGYGTGSHCIVWIWNW